MGAAAHVGRDRARTARLRAARERRLELDPDQVERERRIDDAVVDVELAWEDRATAQEAVGAAEVAASVALERLLAERVSASDVARLTGLDRETLRRLRHLTSSR